MEVRPDQKEIVIGCGRNGSDDTSAGARMGIRACKAHGYAGARGEGAAMVTKWRVVRIPIRAIIEKFR